MKIFLHAGIAGMNDHSQLSNNFKGRYPATALFSTELTVLSKRVGAHVLVSEYIKLYCCITISQICTLFTKKHWGYVMDIIRYYFHFLFLIQILNDCTAPSKPSSEGHICVLLNCFCCFQHYWWHCDEHSYLNLWVHFIYFIDSLWIHIIHHNPTHLPVPLYQPSILATSPQKKTKHKNKKLKCKLKKEKNLPVEAAVLWVHFQIILLRSTPGIGLTHWRRMDAFHDVGGCSVCYK